MKSRKQYVNLADRKSAMELLKELYGNFEVKDDDKSGVSEGMAGTNRASNVAVCAPEVEGLLLQK
jgi:hypothetical protein